VTLVANKIEESLQMTFAKIVIPGEAALVGVAKAVVEVAEGVDVNSAILVMTDIVEGSRSMDEPPSKV
jgi:hypothetical protein